MVTTRTMRGTTAAAVALAGLLGIAGAHAATLADEAYADRYDYLCDPDTTPTWDAWPPDGCCAAEFGDACTDSGGHPDATDRRNILLVVSDDHDYCLFGFMAGLCSNDPTQDCTKESDCGSSGRCVGSRDFGACSTTTTTACYVTADCPGSETCNHSLPSGLRLRLNDLTCRNRQPKRPKSGVEWCDPSDTYEQKRDRKQLEFSREGAPCHRGDDAPMPADAFPVPFTPHLDALATTGVLFPRAYVAGIICKNSRRAMLHGRHLRHLQWLWANGGKGTSECKRSAVGDARKGCLKETEQGSCASTCAPAHTLAWWLDNDRVATPSNVNLPAGEEGYDRFGFAKLDVMKEGRGGFAPKGSSGHGGSKTGRSPGKVLCEEDADCETVLTSTTTDLTASALPYPTQEVFDVRGRSHYDLTEALHETMDMDGTKPVQKKPAFLWWGPHIPHAGPKAEPFLQNLYDGDGTLGDDKANLHKTAWGHYARVSWLDASLGGVIYHLRRACSCKPDASGAQSLWDNTVVLFLSDQGWLLPEAKSNTHENTQRTPLIINAPEMRGEDPETPPAVFEHEMASSVDLMPTIMAYAGDVRYFPAGSGGNDNADEYPLGRNLKNWTETSDPDEWDRRRNLTFGEDLNSQGSGNTNPAGPSPRHIVTRPGLFGVCATPYNFSAANDPVRDNDPAALCVGDICHVHPCLSADDCEEVGSGLGDCIDKSHQSDPEWKRCVNRPLRRCDADSDCAPGNWILNWCVQQPGQPSGVKWCQPGRGRKGFYNDFTGRACTTAADCVPPGVCQPMLLKVEWGGQGDDPNAIWDLDWDPDQRTNLLSLQGSGEYFGLDSISEGSLTNRFNDCMGHFLEQDENDNHDWDNSGQGGMPVCDLRGWPLEGEE